MASRNLLRTWVLSTTATAGLLPVASGQTPPSDVPVLPAIPLAPTAPGVPTPPVIPSSAAAVVPVVVPVAPTVPGVEPPAPAPLPMPAPLTPPSAIPPAVSDPIPAPAPMLAPAATPPTSVPGAQAGASIPPAVSVPAPTPSVINHVTPSSRSPQVSNNAVPEMLSEARAAYARLRDYACHYFRQEKVRGLLVPEQRCELRVRTEPFSVHVKVVSPNEFAHRETSMISGRNAGKVWFKDRDTLRFISTEATDPRVLRDTRHTLSDTGLLAVIDRIEKAVRLENRLNHPVQVLVSDAIFVGRPCKRYEIFCDRPHRLRYAARHVVYIDTETKLPVRYEAYDQPTPGGPAEGELIEVQSFVGLKFNQGMGDAVFER